jgi:hypothetical protein
MRIFPLRQPLRSFAAAAAPGIPGPPDRVAGPQQMPPLLAVAGPQLGACFKAWAALGLESRSARLFLGQADSR